MGHVKVDVGKKARMYEMKYALNDREGVRMLLTDFHKLSSARFLGDLNASDILIDLQRAIALADLTDRQRRIVDLVYARGYSCLEVAEMFGAFRQSVSRSLIFAEERIADIYRAWEYSDITVAYVDDEEGAE